MFLFDGSGVVSCVRRGDAAVEGEEKRVWWCQRERRTKTGLEGDGEELRAG